MSPIDAQTPLGFWDTNKSPNLGQTTRPRDNQKKKENQPNIGFCHAGRPQSKIERKKKER